MTMRYAHLAPEHKLQAVQKLAAFAPTQKKDVVTFSHWTTPGLKPREGPRKLTATKTATGTNSGFRVKADDKA